MSEVPVTIPVADTVLIGDVQRHGPEGVLLLPGWGGTRYGPQRILVDTASSLGDAGFTTLRIDYRGRGDSPGDSATVTLDSMIDDAAAAAHWLRASGITHLHLVGICSGGNVALGAASIVPDVHQVICWSLLPFMEHKSLVTPAGRDGDRLRTLVRKALQPATWTKLLRGEANVRGALHATAKDPEGDDDERRRKTSSRDLLRGLEGFSGRLHLLYGSGDPQAAGSRTFFEAWCRRHRIPVETHIIDGAPHNFVTAEWTRQVVERTVDWIAGVSAVS
jgi:pimeloyl-ACP methyl ester carboxylesterase